MVGSVDIRRGTIDDARACHDLLWASITDLGQRVGNPLEGSADVWWLNLESLHRLLAEHSAEWWVAEEADSGEIVGYARSVAREEMLELTELFVRPGRQSAGLGRQLIERAFPLERAGARVIVATGDVRALSRYHRAGTYIQFPILSLSGTPSAVGVDGPLEAIRLRADADLNEVTELDRRIVGYSRSEAEFRWLLSNREGYLYRDAGRLAAIAFVGKAGSGPIAALDPDALPQVLRHVEQRAATLGVEQLELEVPSLNVVTVRHLLGRGFRLAQWINYFMADRSFGQFDRYVCFSPPLLL